MLELSGCYVCVSLGDIDQSRKARFISQIEGKLIAYTYIYMCVRMCVVNHFDPYVSTQHAHTHPHIVYYHLQS